MSGLTPNAPQPIDVIVHQASRLFEIAFDDGTRGQLTHEFLRVHSPSAEVRGHGAGQEVLHTGKETVRINAAEPVGHYALKLVFSDGHDSGLYTWDYLHRLCHEHETMWQAYLDRLDAVGASRDPRAPVPEALRPAAKSCGSKS